MTQDAVSENSALEKEVRRALLEEWDPIGVRAFPEAFGEYDGYVGAICSLLIRGCSAEDLFDFLWGIETQHMGLSGDWSTTRAFADRLWERAEARGGNAVS